MLAGGGPGGEGGGGGEGVRYLVGNQKGSVGDDGALTADFRGVRGKHRLREKVHGGGG